jgi:hypothetical protein
MQNKLYIFNFVWNILLLNLNKIIRTTTTTTTTTNQSDPIKYIKEKQ